MKSTYEIVLWVGSNCPDISSESFELHEAEQALQAFKENVEIAADYLEANPEEGFPYISIEKINGLWREDCVSFGHQGSFGSSSGFDKDFTELPKYVQKICAKLIAYDLSDK